MERSSVRMLQEAMNGRVTKHRARDRLKASNWNLKLAAELFYKEDDQELGRWPSCEDVIRDLESKFEHRSEHRMFACDDCDQTWWRCVTSRKPVSKCPKCLVKFDAITRSMEYGWCRFECVHCDHVFTGYGIMGRRTESPCYRCNRYLYPTRVLPPEKRRARKSTSTHSCTGNNCCNRARGRKARGECVHPRSTRKHVVVASTRHVSTGSTVDTFLSQDDHAGTPYRAELSDIEEEEDM